MCLILPVYYTQHDDREVDGEQLWLTLAADCF